MRTENVSAAGGDELPAGDYVALSVADSGSGIAPEHLAKVFDPFFTTKEPGKGSGLGLSMVYGFAQQSGGQVRIASELGRGTTVTMLLPRTDARPERAAARPGDSAEPLPQARAGETVLLVEDNEEVRRQGVAALRSFGYRVIEAADARSRVAYLSFVTRQAERHGWPWAVWQFSHDFAIFDMDGGRWNRDLLDALVPPRSHGREGAQGAPRIPR